MNPEKTSDTTVAVEQQEQSTRQYVGRSTAHNLWAVEEGRSSQGSLQMWLDLSNLVRNNRPSPFNANYHISLQEALALLREREGAEQTPRELMVLVRAYQVDIADIEQHPERWTNKYLTPERARAWYEQQIGRIKRVFSTVSMRVPE